MANWFFFRQQPALCNVVGAKGIWKMNHKWLNSHETLTEIFRFDCLMRFGKNGGTQWMLSSDTFYTTMLKSITLLTPWYKITLFPSWTGCNFYQVLFFFLICLFAICFLISLFAKCSKCLSDIITLKCIAILR